MSMITRGAMKVTLPVYCIQYSPQCQSQDYCSSIIDLQHMSFGALTWAGLRGYVSTCAYWFYGPRYNHLVLLCQSKLYHTTGSKPHILALRIETPQLSEDIASTAIILNGY
jgi:hypothetical protein